MFKNCCVLKWGQTQRGIKRVHVKYYISFSFFLNLFLGVLGLCGCARAFSSCGEWGLFFLAVDGLLTVVASLVVEHGI